VVACVTMLLGLVLFGILLNIVGKTIMVLLFGEHITEDEKVPSKDMTIDTLSKLQWINANKSLQLKGMTDDQVKELFKSI